MLANGRRPSRPWKLWLSALPAGKRDKRGSMSATLSSVPAKMVRLRQKRMSRIKSVATVTTVVSGDPGSLCVTDAKRGPPYHRRPIDCWTIRAGETDGGGDDIEMPVAGLMIGIALRARVAEGWWSFRPEW